MLTKEKIIQDLTKLGVGQGMMLEVHSSLSSFGFVDGGADTVISALKECVGNEGSIFMPALRLSKELELTEQDRQLGITVKIKILPENCDKSAMGIIADTFRKMPDTYTGKGIFRISGWGKYGEKAIDSGLDYALHNGGKALLLGVDIYRLTAMHYVENNMPDEIKNMSLPNETINKIYPQNEWFIETKHPPIKAWYTIQNMAYEKGLIKDCCIGNCKAMFFDLWDIVSIYESELKNNPYKLYGLK